MSGTSSRSELWVSAALGLGLCLLYAFSAPHGVALEDDGFFLLAAHFLGIAHPPGYPLWVLLAHAVSLVPVGAEAWRLHFLSGIYGALACIALLRVLRRLGVPLASAALAAACYGVSRVFWSQSIIAEVYTLNALIVFALVAWLLSWRAAPTARGAFGLGLLYGLGLCNHWPLLILETPALLLFAAPAWRAVLRYLALALAGVALGLLPYAWMVWRSQQDPVISFYGPMESWRDFWFVLSRGGYAGIDTSDTAGWADQFQYYAFALRELAVQFGPPGAALLALGIVLRLREGARARSTDDLAVLLGLLGPTFVLLTLLHFDYESVHRNVFKVYPLAAYGFAAIFLAHGIEAVRTRLAARRLRAAAIGGAALLLAAPLALGARENLRGDYEFGERYGRAVLAIPEPGALLFVHGDSTDGPAAWLHRVEGVRPDLTLYETWGLILDTRPFRADRDPPEVRAQRLRELADGAKVPVYYTSAIPHAGASDWLGLMRRVSRDGPAGTERMVAAPPALEFYDWLLRQPPSSDGATRSMTHILVGGMGAWLLRLPEQDLAPAFQAWRRVALEQSRNTLQGCLAQAEVLLALRGSDGVHEVLALLDRADRLRDQAETKQETALIEVLRARAAAIAGGPAVPAAGTPAPSRQ